MDNKLQSTLILPENLLLQEKNIQPQIKPQLPNKAYDISSSTDVYITNDTKNWMIGASSNGLGHVHAHDPGPDHAPKFSLNYPDNKILAITRGALFKIVDKDKCNYHSTSCWLLGLNPRCLLHQQRLEI